jgi:hypothetical protein
MEQLGPAGPAYLLFRRNYQWLQLCLQKAAAGADAAAQPELGPALARLIDELPQQVGG